MDNNEIPRSSGGASKEAPPIPLSAYIQVSWSRAARRVPLADVPFAGVPLGSHHDVSKYSDAEPDAVRTRKTRMALNRAAKRAVQECLRQAPLKISRGVAQDTEQTLEVDLSFVSDDEIAVLNGDYRGRPRPTDVLSFAQCEDDELVPLILSEAGNAATAGQSTPVSLGDIVISIDTARRQAIELKHDLLTEVMFLAVHGTLHLCGYDHGTAAQRRVMWKWQEKIVASLTPADPA